MKNGVCTTFFYMQVLVNQMKVYGSESAVITLSFASSPELTLSTADPEEGKIVSGSAVLTINLRNYPLCNHDSCDVIIYFKNIIFFANDDAVLVLISRIVSLYIYVPAGRPLLMLCISSI